PIDKGIEYAEHIAEELRRRGIRAQAMHSKNIKAIEAFIAGEIDVLVGVATYYGVLVRGIDLPETIRYAIFVGIPRHKIALRLKEVKAQDVLRLLPIIRDVVKDDELRRKIEGYIARMRRLIRRAGGYVIERLNQILSGERKAETRGEKEFIEAYNILKELTNRKDIIDALKDHPEVSIIEEEGELYILIPDAPTYIQASGRTSRLFLGGISKGLSIVLVDDIKLLKGLERRLKWIMEDFSFTHLSEVDIDSVIGEIDHDRELISKLRAGEVPEEIRVGKKGLMELKTALLVVESPNKARTIARFFGRPSTREYGRLKVYEVNLGNYTLLITASGGHIYDLIQDLPFPGINHIYGVSLVSDKGVGLRFIPVYTTLKRCLDKGHQFALEVPEGEVIRCPSCGSTNIYDAVNAVEAVRDVAMEVDEILVGTDPDTEGEKIAFDLINVILPYNKSVKRVEFHEVTRRAIINAINNPRDINIDLVKAQLVRRIEDRWIGFSLSKQLQTEFWQQFCRNLEEILKQHRARGRTAAILRDLCSRYVSSY
ncbi:MAG TPA: reverse gyrase, partial [Acidilobales archaeon]|nr:reverse gyrase [Acidilobales archaeon]